MLLTPVPSPSVSVNEHKGARIVNNSDRDHSTHSLPIQYMPNSNGLLLIDQVVTNVRQVRDNIPSVRKLDWSFLNVGDNEAKTLGEALRYNSHLRQVRLHHNLIGNTGARALAQGMERNRSVLFFSGLESNSRITNTEIIDEIKFYVRRNQLEHGRHCPLLPSFSQEQPTDEGSRQVRLSPRLSSCQQMKDLVPPSILRICYDLHNQRGQNSIITELNMAWHSIDDAGAQAIGNALKSSPSMRRIVLDYNHIGNFGATAIGHGALRCPDLEELSIKHNHIGDAGIAALTSLSQLCKLWINENEISKLACESIAQALSLLPNSQATTNSEKKPGSWSSLTLLDVSGNSAIGEAMPEIAKSLHSNTILEVLIAEKCRIDDFGCQSVARSLEFNRIAIVDFGRNLIGNSGAVALAQAIERDKKRKLRRLVLCGNQIGLGGADAIAIAVSEVDHVVEIDLDENLPIDVSDPTILGTIRKLVARNADKKDYRNWDQTSIVTRRTKNSRSCQGLPDLVSSPVTVSSDLTCDSDCHDDGEEKGGFTSRLQNDPGLTELHLNNAGIGELNIGELCKALWSNRTVKELQLAGNFITAKATAVLCKALQMSNIVEKLNLSSNPIGDTGAIAIANYIHCRPDCRLKGLWLLSTGIGDAGASAIAKAQRIHPLEELYLQKNNVGPQGVADLAATLSTDTVLRVLNLHQNRLGDDGVLALANEGLFQNESSRLEQLVLSSNGICNNAAVALGAYLGWNPSIRILDLSMNRISDAGIKVLSVGLTQNFRLNCLNLGANLITDTGVKALAKALQLNRSLESLCLYRNPCIGQVGVKAMVHVLEDNPALSVIAGLPEEGVDPDVWSAVRLLMCRKRNI